MRWFAPVEPAGVAGMAMVHLVGAFVAGDADLLRIDDDDVVTGVDMGGKNRLVLAAKPFGDFARQPSQRPVGGVHHVPVPLYRFWFCTVGGHLILLYLVKP